MSQVNEFLNNLLTPPGEPSQGDYGTKREGFPYPQGAGLSEWYPVLTRLWDSRVLLGPSGSAGVEHFSMLSQESNANLGNYLAICRLVSYAVCSAYICCLAVIKHNVTAH